MDKKDIACDSHGCKDPAFVKVTWMGKIPWSGTLCQMHLAEAWDKNGKALCQKQMADIRLEKI